MKENNTYYDDMDGLNLPGSLRVNPFVVPENYFETLSFSILVQARLGGLSNSENTGFTVPDTYFSELTDNIQLGARIEKYKNTKGLGWNVPTRYFEDLSDKILAQTRIQATTKKEELEVPIGYFDSLSTRIQTKIFEEKLKERISADGFTIPENYTGILKDKIVAQTVEKEKGGVRKLNVNKWVQYVAAACAAVVIGVGSYTALTYTSRADFSESQLATIPQDEIINYLSASNEDYDILYIMECMDHSHGSDGICTHVKEDDIKDYLNYAL